MSPQVTLIASGQEQSLLGKRWVRSLFGNTCSAFSSLVVCLGKTKNSLSKYSEPYLMPKILRFAQNSQCV